MTVAKTLMNYLKERGVVYEMVEHPHTATSMETAHAAHLPAHQIAKAVVLKDTAGYVLGVVPANHQLEIEWVNEVLGRSLEMAEEKEFAALFTDCEVGAVPALGAAYGIQVVWDDELIYTSDIYIEAGDHEHLIWLERRDFRKLMEGLPHSIISKDEEVGCWKY
jgi:Ala-tRNA(Pro) deacylase